MAFLAYALPPLSGLLAYLYGRGVRTRMHGLQSVLFGTLWPAGLFGAATLSSTATRAVALAGAVVWLLLVLLTLVGRDPSLPVLGPALRRIAGASVREL